MSIVTAWPTRVVDTRPPAEKPLPHGFRIRLAHDVRVRSRSDGGVLLGGSPLRVLRLNKSAWQELTALAQGSAVQSAASGRVAARLVDAGIAEPVPPAAGPGVDDVTIVIPVRDRPEALARCLSTVGSAAAVLVVDDDSVAPDLVWATAEAAGAQVVSRSSNGGPAAARNTGLAACRTPLIAFVDSDCSPEAGWLQTLLPHFGDPAVAAVAPRIVGLPTGSWLGRYDTQRSALDMGERPGRVAPLSRIGYVPAAAIVVRCSALGPGFAERLRVGEDVDLVWRLEAQGWRVRYEPAARVRHENRAAVSAWVRRRYEYGTSGGQLGLRHPGKVPPAVTSLVALTPLVLVRRGASLVGAAVAAASTVGLARRLPPFAGRRREALRLMVMGVATTALGVSRAATRAWLPVTLGLLIQPGRWRIAVVMLAQPVGTWASRRPALDLARWTVAYLLDDAAYCTGLWVGSFRARTLQPLLPAVPEWPKWPKWPATIPAEPPMPD
jgi:mycofactocin system glycosyltransferase